MCRYDDDYDWYVDAESLVTLDVDQRCEDCGRMVPAGEEIVQFVASAAYDDDANHVIVAQRKIDDDHRWYRPGAPHIVLPDDDEISDAFAALGFIIDEVNEHELNPPDPEYHYSCQQCRAANLWLQEICGQHTVLVTVIDLEEHWHEYTPTDLGPDFGTLYRLSRQRWRTRDFDVTIPPHVIDRLARDAVAYANAHGLAHV